MKLSEIVIDLKGKISNFLTKTNSQGIIIIWGATATGKTNLAVQLAENFPIQIISADSRQIYQYMDIGTDKVSKLIREQIKHYQIDIIKPDEYYSAGTWKNDTEKIILQIQQIHNIPIITGGTGLYINTIYKNFSMPEAEPDFAYRQLLYQEEEAHPGILYQKLQLIDPEEAQKLHPNSLRYLVRALEIFKQTGKLKSEIMISQSVKQPILLIGLWREKEDTNMRINKRIKEMLHNGLIEEVNWLLNQGYQPNLQSMQGIGYKEIVGYLENRYSLEKAEEHLKRNTHHYAKRQRTWFRRYILDAKVNPVNNVEYLLYLLN